MSAKKILKICGGIIVFLTLPTLLFFGYLYFKYDEDLPQGTPSKAADVVAQNMLDALDYEAYKKQIILNGHLVSVIILNGKKVKIL
ncbi:hypothetical protein [Formosa algae]|uniref:hypothetical protein n=1 Tax=Formosa algae TaxID=225843 RepID=UPI00209C1A0C|nr:hypothetical protein [Formosa algae]